MRERILSGRILRDANVVKESRIHARHGAGCGCIGKALAESPRACFYPSTLAISKGDNVYLIDAALSLAAGYLEQKRPQFDCTLDVFGRCQSTAAL